MFGLYSQTGDFYSPRHHHNFAQWRYQLEGECNFEKNGVATPGVLTFIPEGAYYGPQTSDGETENFRWRPVDGLWGVEEKAYGTFSDCAFGAASGRLEANVYRRHTGLRLETGDMAEFRADDTSEILYLGLPEIAKLRQPLPEMDAARDEELARA